MRTRPVVCAPVLVLLAALTTPWPASGEVATGTVGVDERLGARVPLDVTLVDEAGQRVTLRSLLDRPAVLTLNYFTCAGLCSPLLNGVAAMLDAIDLVPGKDFVVLTVSFDARDTPEIAARKRVNYLKFMKRPIVPAAWRFLTGAEGETKALADAVGFEFERAGEGFVHPGVIVVLTADGRVARYIHGTSFLPADVQMAVSDAARGLVRPTIAQFPAYCATSEPEGRRVARRMIRIAGLVTLGVAGLFVGGIVLRGRTRREGKER